MAEKNICADIAPNVYFTGDKFSIWHGKDKHAFKKGKDVAKNIADLVD